MSKEKKRKEHKFLNKHTKAGVLLLMFGCFIIFDVLAGVTGGMIGHETGVGAGGIIGSFIALIIWFNLFKPEYKWKPEPGDWAKPSSCFFL